MKASDRDSFCGLKDNVKSNRAYKSLKVSKSVHSQVLEGKLFIAAMPTLPVVLEVEVTLLGTTGVT